MEKHWKIEKTVKRRIFRSFWIWLFSGLLNKKLKICSLKDLLIYNNINNISEFSPVFHIDMSLLSSQGPRKQYLKVSYTT
jgi:hypothetical protein